MEIENHIFKNLQFLKSPNFNDRPNQEEIRLIVIHSISLPPKNMAINMLKIFS